MTVISKSGWTLNPSKCTFGKKEINFWGMIHGEEGVHADPAKVQALDYITEPHSDFIPIFPQRFRNFARINK